MYNLKYIDNFGTAFFFQPLTFPLYRKLMSTEKLEKSVIAIGAINELNQPVGLVLAQIKSHNHSIEVLSLYVKSDLRGKGMADVLLAHLEKESLKRGFKNIDISYTTGQSSTIALEKLLKKRDWEKPKTRQFIYKCDRKMLEAPWLHQKYNLPSGFSLFLWKDITSGEKQKIMERQEAEKWIPQDLVPFQYEKSFEPLNSMGLRYQERIVGWLITHRIIDNTIRYTCGFVQKELQAFGLIFPLYIEAAKRQASFFPSYKASWAVPIAHKSMISFAQRNLAPYAISSEQSKFSSKRFR
jgi:predicted GNAT family acetyltransferase